jgi:hypothetical protein
MATNCHVVPTSPKMSRSPLLSSVNTSPSATAGDCCGQGLIEPRPALKMRLPSAASSASKSPLWAGPGLIPT